MAGPRGWLPGTAIALSAFANAFLIYAVHHALTREPPPPPDDELGGDDRDESDPYQVELVRPEGLALLSGIELVALPAPPSPAGAAIPAPSPTTMRLGTGRGVSTGGTSGATVEAPPGRTGGSGVLGMRGRRHDLSISTDAMTRILGNDYELPEPVEPTGRIRPNGARGGKIDDAVATVTVHPDGTVDLKSKPHVKIHIGPPIPTMKDIRAFGENIATWYADPYKRYREVGRMQDLPRHMTAVPGACEKWGDPNCEPGTDEGEAPRGRMQQAGETGVLPVLWGKLDLTGWLMEKTVGDAYASRKLKLLDSTRAERVAAGTAYRAQRQARSAEYIQKNLDALWRATADAAERRAALFAMWDECTEDDAGRRARAMVIGWIRTHLPAGSAGAYPADELAKLDAKRASTEHFAPY